MKIELKPCPFCKEVPKRILAYPMPYRQGYPHSLTAMYEAKIAHHCIEVGVSVTASGSGSTEQGAKEDAARQWNHRGMGQPAEHYVGVSGL